MTVKELAECSTLLETNYKNVFAEGDIEVKKLKQEKYQLPIEVYYEKKTRDLEKIENTRMEWSAETSQKERERLKSKLKDLEKKIVTLINTHHACTSDLNKEIENQSMKAWCEETKIGKSH